MSLKTININGTPYEIGVSAEKIAEALGLDLERFIELLSRDLYCPTLTSAPTSSTRTYTDTDASTNTFQIGQTCRWLDGSTYKIAILADITDSEASWYTMPEDWASQLSAKQDTISDLSTIRSGAAAGATAVQPSTLAAVATSGSYNDLSDSPTVLTGGSQTTTSSEDGGTNVYTFTKSDGTTSTLSVKNGSKGSTGEKGEKGDKGDTGDTGPQGPAGTNATTTAVATTAANGLMSSSDKTKLDGIATGATANTGTITEVQANGTSVATSGVADIPAATTSAYGVTKLSSSTSSTSTSLAATASAVRSAYVLANGKVTAHSGYLTAVQVVSALPSSPSATTLYIIT